MNKHFIRERGLCIIRCFFGPQKLTQNIQKHVLRDEESPCEEMCSLFSTVTENYQFVQITKGKWKFECLVSHVTENKFETFFLS